MSYVRESVISYVDEDGNKVEVSRTAALPVTNDKWDSLLDELNKIRVQQEITNMLLKGVLQ